jgi:DNA-binding NarL/FixJ family response regulator
MRVALVDDDADVRLLVAMHMALDSRFELIAEATDGAEAMQLLDRRDIDAMILDMHMPTISGAEVLRLARERRPDLRVVAFSADAAILIEAAGAGAAATFVKGEPLDVLLEILAVGCAA